MSEDELRAMIAEIDEKRNRARLLTRMTEWPMFAPSKVTADKKRGLFRWFGSVSDKPLNFVELTRDERSELRDWLYAKATRLSAEANETASNLGRSES